jgi:fructokinase
MAAANEQAGLSGRPLVFGEIVFDEIGDGEHRLGGAPLNVAWHLRGFGFAPLLVSRVGADALGERALERLRAGGVDTRGVQIDAARPTGRVIVAMTGDEPHFTISDDQAYDYIDSAALPELAAGPFAFLYHGTLATRHLQSAEALRALRLSRLPTFVDVNLREPWWRRAAIDEWLTGARWLKLNAAELVELSDGPAGTLLQRAEALRKRFRLELVVVTSGEQGSTAVTQGLSFTQRPERVRDFVDSVGAGDAFSSVLLVAIARAWPLQLALQRAAAFAAAICEVRGALPPDDTLYQRFLRVWRA